jgi:hypothetical protein
MQQRLREWKRSLDRFWSVAAPDYLDAARLAAEIAHDSDDVALRQAAAQALPSLRSATLKKAGQSSKDLARRRLGVVRNILHAATVPQFGKRGTVPKLLTSEQRHRNNVIGNCSACRSTDGWRAPKSIKPTSAPPSLRIRTAAATRGDFTSYPWRGIR